MPTRAPRCRTPRPSPAPASDGRRTRLLAVGPPQVRTKEQLAQALRRPNRDPTAGSAVGYHASVAEIGPRAARRPRRHAGPDPAPQRRDVDPELGGAVPRRPRRSSGRTAAQRRRLGGRPAAPGDGARRHHRPPRRLRRHRNHRRHTGSHRRRRGRCRWRIGAVRSRSDCTSSRRVSASCTTTGSTSTSSSAAGRSPRRRRPGRAALCHPRPAGRRARRIAFGGRPSARPDRTRRCRPRRHGRRPGGRRGHRRHPAQLRRRTRRALSARRAADEHPQLWRVASLLRAGIPMAASTDAPFGGMDPWAAMRAAVHRTTAGETFSAPTSGSPPRRRCACFSVTRPPVGAAHGRGRSAGRPDGAHAGRTPVETLASDMVATTIVGGRVSLSAGCGGR